MRVRPLCTLLGLLAVVGCHAQTLQPIPAGGGGGPLPTAPPTAAPVGPVVVSPSPASGGFPVLLPPLSPAPANPAPPGMGGGGGTGTGMSPAPGVAGGVTPATTSPTPYGQPSNPPLQVIP